METTRFLETIIGKADWYCAVGITESGKTIQKFFKRIEDMADAAINFDRNDINSFYAMGAFDQDQSRKAEDVISLKAFYLDIDCGEGKEYDSKEEALTSLNLFCKKFRLKKPLLVDSGGGLHAYWVLKEAVPVAEWQPVAEKFRQLCLNNDLRIDTKVTQDPARILRVPGTHNHKTKYGGLRPKARVLSTREPKPLPFRFFEELTEGVVVVNARASKLSRTASAMLDALSGQKRSVFKTILQKTQNGRGCAQLGHIIKNQTTIDEPAWRAGLSIAQHCEDRERAIHFISRKHEEYDPDETESKAAATKGPYHCTSFEEILPGGCEGCPHKGKITSPIVLGIEFKEADPDDNLIATDDNGEHEPELPENLIPEYPHPYKRKAGGGVYLPVRDEEGDIEEFDICPYDLYVTRRVRDKEQGECIVINLVLPKDGKQTFLLPLTAATAREEFRRQMSAQGIFMTGKVEPLMKYIETWVKELQYRSKADDSRRQFGWVDDATAFVIGDMEITKDEIRTNYPSPPTALFFPYMGIKGDLDGWKELAESYNIPELAVHQYLMASSFGSVLMEFIDNIQAAGLHIYSQDSGFGKSAIKEAMLTAWGNPKGLLLSGEDTNNSLFNRAETFKNLPLCIDEATQMSPKNISDFCMLISQGRQKDRMRSGSNSQRERGEPWSFIVTTSANVSLLERISSIKGMAKAEAQRILEVEVEGFNFNEQNDANEKSMWFNSQVISHYGLAGPAFVKYVLNNMDSIKRLLFETQIKVDKALGLDHKNRFWSAHVTTTIAAAVICREIGLLRYEIDTLMLAAADIIKQNKTKVISITKSPSDILTDYLFEHYDNIIHVYSSADRRSDKMDVSPLDTYIAPSKQARGRIVARIEPDVQMLYLVPKPLREWCVKHQINYGELYKNMKREMGGVTKKIRISRGTEINLPPTDVMVIDCNRYNKLDLDLTRDENEEEVTFAEDLDEYAGDTGD